MQTSEIEKSVAQQIKLSSKLNKLDAKNMLSFSVTGLNEEAGEVSGVLCRELYKDIAMPRDRWLEELGDVLWYLTAALRAKGITFDELWAYNLKKLEERYGEFREKE